MSVRKVVHILLLICAAGGLRAVGPVVWQTIFEVLPAEVHVRDLTPAVVADHQWFAVRGRVAPEYAAVVKDENSAAAAWL